MSSSNFEDPQLPQVVAVSNQGRDLISVRLCGILESNNQRNVSKI